MLAANKEGAKCTIAGKIVSVSGKKLVCAQVAKSLKWIAPHICCPFAALEGVGADSSSVSNSRRFDLCNKIH